VIFPDSTLPEPTNGGFANQEDFRKFVTSSSNVQWNSQLHVRPSAERLADYKDETIADAFPEHFPFGFAGLLGDPAILDLPEKHKRRYSRKRRDIILKCLTHRTAAFHQAMFILVVDNIFQQFCHG
jgi:hypothetical protein